MVGFGDFQKLLNSAFTKRLLTPGYWFMTADDLTSAAERLAPDIEKFWKSLASPEESPSLSTLSGSRFQHIFMMLYGFAIENLCKGHVVTKLSTVNRSFAKLGRLPRQLKTHDLESLVTKEIGLKVGDHEIDLLKRLKATVEWSGRYPVSLGPLAQKKESAKEQMLAMPTGLMEDDLPRVRQLTQRIRNRVEELSAMFP